MSSTERRRHEAEAAFAGHATSHHGPEETAELGSSSATLAASQPPRHKEATDSLATTLPTSPLANDTLTPGSSASTGADDSGVGIHPETEAEVQTKAHAPVTEPISVPYLLVGGGTASFAAMEAIHAKDPQAQVCFTVSLSLC